MKKLDFALDKMEDILCTIFAVIMAVSVLIQVVNRNTVQLSLTWCEELARYCMVWLIFIGISAGVKKGSHIGVDALVNTFPPKFKRNFKIVINCIITLLYGYLTVLATEITLGIRETGQVSPAMQVPMYIVYAGLIVGLFMSTLRAVMVTANLITNKDVSEEHNTLEF